VKNAPLIFSLAICTRDGAERLPELFAALRAMVVPEGISWEIVVVNNASQDATEAVARQELACFSAPTRVVLESQSGLVFARNTAARTACGQWLAFLDDDNLPAADWLVQMVEVVRLGGDKLGAFSGEVRPKWTVQPPQGIGQLVNFLGCHEAATAPFRYDAERGVLPPGAGLVVRRAAWLAAVPRPEQLFFTGRISGHLLGGEDIECLTYLNRAGWEIWHFPALLIHHVMSSGRVKPEYLNGLCRAGGLVRHHLRMMRISAPVRPVAVAGFLALDAIRLTGHVVRHPWLNQGDIVNRCRRQYLVGTLVSPVFLWGWQTRRLHAANGGHTSVQKP
jgi:glycosyltransferase involved in cell wall biosynthesis